MQHIHCLHDFPFLFIYSPHGILGPHAKATTSYRHLTEYDWHFFVFRWFPIHAKYAYQRNSVFWTKNILPPFFLTELNWVTQFVPSSEYLQTMWILTSLHSHHTILPWKFCPLYRKCQALLHSLTAEVRCSFVYWHLCYLRICGFVN